MLWQTVALAAALAAVEGAFVDPSRACSASGQGCPMDCSPSSKKGLQPECWAFLDMNGYIKNWVAEHGTESGIETVGFAQAYLRWSGENEKTCNLITSDTCSAPEADDTKYKNPQQYYTLWNIFAIYQVYNQYSTALTASQALAAAKMGQIVNMVDPPVEHEVSTPVWQKILTTTLLYTWFFWTGSTFIDATAITFPVNLLLSGIYAAYKTPPLDHPKAGYSETAQARFTSLANIGADLADIVADYQKKVLNEVQIIQDNVETFLAICGPGGFSQRITLPLTDQSANIYRSFELFVLSEALAASGVFIVKSIGIDPRSVPGIYCPGFGPAGNCYTWWYDEKNGNTYSFHDPKKGSRDFTELIDYIWAQKLVKDMSAIFKTEDCQGKSMPPAFELDNPDPSQMCLVTTKICEAYYSGGELEQSLKQFQNCDKDKTFFTSCTEGFYLGKRKLPMSYLGPWLERGYFCRG